MDRIVKGVSVHTSIPTPALLNPAQAFETVNKHSLTISGIIRWKKSLGHPHAKPVTIFVKGTQSPSQFCSAFDIECTHRSDGAHAMADACDERIEVSVGKLSCWDGPSDPTFFEVVYNVSQLEAIGGYGLRVVLKSESTWENGGELLSGSRIFMPSDSFGDVQPFVAPPLCPQFAAVGKVSIGLDGPADFAIVNFVMSAP